MIDVFLHKVTDTIKKYNMFEMSERLLVCLSGGADSVSLLLCLKRLGYDICACHVNHQLRGEESIRDQRFCEELCKTLDIELYTYRVDVKEYCKEYGVSTEEGARELRYDIFGRINADKICTAHTLSDCLETTVFNLARGTGLKGLCSIPPKRDNIVRPLIECTRSEIIAFLNESGQEYVTDSTNLSDDYSRNVIRHNVVPVLEKINTSLFKSYKNTLDYLRKDLDFLEKAAESAYISCCEENAIKLDVFNKLDRAIKDRVIMLWLKDNKLSVSNESVSSVVMTAENNGKYNISGKIFAVCGKGLMELLSYDENVYAEQDCVRIDGDGKYSYCSRNIEFKIISTSEIGTDILNVHKKFANCCMDYDKIIGGLVIRKRSEGDKIRLVNRDFDSSVRKLVNQYFRLGQRNSAILLYDDNGAVFVEGFGVSDRVKVTEDTSHLLVFKF